MKITTLILITAIMQVSAISFAQKITLSEKNATLSNVFEKIRSQSGYDFIVTRDMLKKASPVSVKAENQELTEVLKMIFDVQPLDFTVEGKIVVVKTKEPSFLDKTKSVILHLVQDLTVRGRVVDENGQPLQGATVTVKGKNRSVKTDQNGAFYLENVGERDQLVISFVGYQSREVKAATDMGSLTMVIADQGLEEVNVVSTGYETLAKERATGSFELIDHKMLNRRTGTDILSRLEGITSGLQFDRRGQSPDQTTANAGNIVIRGISTLSSNIKTPLIVLDNFPYEGDILNINPSDIEQVTVLKDAAAASIWGARAGNGVIVITTKKGKLNSALKISSGANLIISEKPDLFAYPTMSSSDFIDVEQYLFRQNFYDAALGNNTTFPVLSPAVEIFDQSRRKLISRSDSTVLIDELKGMDVRRDFDK